ncbi:MAG: tetratricopeptide repeat protein [Ignavibacteriaceae bacterium]
MLFNFGYDDGHRTKGILLLLLVFFSFNMILLPQGFNETDSLLSLLPYAKDTVKIKILNELSQRYSEVPDSMGLVYGRKAVALSKELGYKRGMALGYLYIGRYYSSMFQYSKSFENYSNSEKLSKEINDLKIYAQVLQNIGVDFDFQGNYPEAINYQRKALTVRTQLGDKNDIAETLINIGISYYHQNELEKALEYYLKAEQLLGELSDLRKLELFTNMGVTYLSQKELSKAQTYFMSTLNLSNDLNDSLGISQTMANIGEVFFELKNYKQALNYHTNALNISRKIDDIEGVAIGLNSLARCYYEMNNFGMALKYSLRSLKIAQEYGLNNDIEEAAFLLSEIYFTTNNYKKSLEYYKLAAETKAQILTYEKVQESGRIESKYEIEKKIEEEKKGKEVEMIKLTMASNMQYYIGISLILGLFITLFFAFKIEVSARIFEILIILSFLLFFEFMLILIGPVVDKQTGGFPLLKLLINAVLAYIISFVNDVSREKLIGRIKEKARIVN